MLVGIDVPPPLMVALEMQAVGRDDPEEALQGCERDRGGADAGEARAFAALEILLVLRRAAIAARGDRLAEALAVLGQFEDRGVARRLRDRGWSRGHSGCREEGVAQEPSPAALHFGDLARIQEVLGGATKATAQSDFHGPQSMERA